MKHVETLITEHAKTICITYTPATNTLDSSDTLQTLKHTEADPNVRSSRTMDSYQQRQQSNLCRYLELETVTKIIIGNNVIARGSMRETNVDWKIP
jgi:hypothetical protein